MAAPTNLDTFVSQRNADRHNGAILSNMAANPTAPEARANMSRLSDSSGVTLPDQGNVGGAFDPFQALAAATAARAANASLAKMQDVMDKNAAAVAERRKTKAYLSLGFGDLAASAKQDGGVAMPVLQDYNTRLKDAGAPYSIDGMVYNPESKAYFVKYRTNRGVVTQRYGAEEMFRNIVDARKSLGDDDEMAHRLAAKAFGDSYGWESAEDKAIRAEGRAETRAIRAEDRAKARVIEAEGRAETRAIEAEGRAEERKEKERAAALDDRKSVMSFARELEKEGADGKDKTALQDGVNELAVRVSALANRNGALFADEKMKKQLEAIKDAETRFGSKYNEGASNDELRRLSVEYAKMAAGLAAQVEAMKEAAQPSIDERNLIRQLNGLPQETLVRIFQKIKKARPSVETPGSKKEEV